VLVGKNNAPIPPEPQDVVYIGPTLPPIRHRRDDVGDSSAVEDLTIEGTSPTSGRA